MGAWNLQDEEDYEVEGEFLSVSLIEKKMGTSKKIYSWEDLTKEWKAAERQQFMGYMMTNFKVCSVRFDVRNKIIDVDVYVKPVDLLDEFQVLKLYHCDGLLLCVAKDLSRLVVCNPFLGQTRIIPPRASFHLHDKYAIGYDRNRKYKILRFMDDANAHMLESEIYDFSTGSWRVLEPTPDCHIESHHLGVSLKGFTYFYSRFLVVRDPRCRPSVKESLVSFDFTLETFGPRMCLPFESSYSDNVTLSCVRQKQLVMLHYHSTMDIWVTTRVKPNSLTWRKFFTVDTEPLSPRFDFSNTGGGGSGSFFIDEKEKVVVVFGTEQLRGATSRYNTAYVLGEHGFSKYTRFGETLRMDRPSKLKLGYTFCFPLVCSSAYSPSLVRVTQRDKDSKRQKEDDV